MSKVVVGRWGKNLAIRVPQEIERAIGLTDGERVEIETSEGEIVIRRPAIHARADAEAAAEEILAESVTHTLDNEAIRALLEEGRRG